MCRLNVGGGGDRSGSKRTKAGRRETPRKRSGRIEVILSKRDMSCFCWVLTKGLQRMCHRGSQDLPCDRRHRRCTAPLGKSCRAGVVRVPLPCVCVSGSPFRGLLRRRRSTFLPPGLPTPPPDPTDPSEGTCDLLLCVHNITTRTKSVFKNSGQDVKQQVM